MSAFRHLLDHSITSLRREYLSPLASVTTDVGGGRNLVNRFPDPLTDLRDALPQLHEGPVSSDEVYPICGKHRYSIQ